MTNLKHLLLLLALLVVTGSCSFGPLWPTPPQALLDSTVALVDEGRPFCAGTWIDQEHIVTAAHCVRDPLFGTLPIVTFAFREDLPREHGALAKKAFEAVVVRTDEDNDVALLIAVDAPPHSFARLAERELEIGEHLRIVGHPLGLTWTFMEGVSNGLRWIDGPDDKRRLVLQIVAPIWYGNSGGGAFNEAGELVGVCSFIMRAPSESFFAPRAAVVLLLK